MKTVLIIIAVIVFAVLMSLVAYFSSKKNVAGTKVDAKMASLVGNKNDGKTIGEIFDDFASHEKYPNYLNAKN